MKQKITLGILLLLCHQAFGLMTYVPLKFDSKNTSVVVVIHGCLQTPESMALGSGWNQIADKENIVVVYPQIPAGSNMIGCWNWFMPENQRADSGQLREVYDQIKKFKETLKIQKAPTFLAGISSGGATVAGLIACFPNDFKAAAIHSGPSYGLARNLQEGEKVLKEGPSAAPAVSDLPCKPQQFEGSLIVLQGTADQTVHPQHVDRLIADFLPGSKPVKALEKTENGLSYTMTNHFVKGQRRGRTILIKDLPHAWSGFNLNLKYPELLGPQGKFPTQLPFFSAQGPSATDWMWEFFETSKLVNRE